MEGTQTKDKRWSAATSPYYYMRSRVLRRVLRRAERREWSVAHTKQAMIERCYKMVTRVRKAIERAQRAAGEQLITEMIEAVMSGNGTVVKMFQAIRAARSGERARHASQKLVSVYMDDDKVGGTGRRWQLEAEVDGTRRQRTVSWEELRTHIRARRTEGKTIGVTKAEVASMTDEEGVEEQWWCEVDGQWYGTVSGGHVVDEPEEVKTEVAEAMRKQANERGGFMRALERVMKMAFGPSEAEEWTEEQHRE